MKNARSAVCFTLLALLGAGSASPLVAQEKVTFPAPFAPSEGFVKAPEKPWRQELSLNGRWQFQPQPVPASFQRNRGVAPELTAPVATRWEKTPLKVPSAWNVNTWGNGRDAGDGTKRPYVADSVYYPSYPASWDGVEMGWLRRSFRVPANWGSRRLVLHFEAVAGDAQILINGKPAGRHFDSFTPFDLDITGLVKRGADNELLVGVRKSNLFDIYSQGYPNFLRRTYPNGSYMDELVGIWNDVSLLGLPAVRVQDAFLKPQVKEGVLEAELTLRNDGVQPQRVEIGGEVKPWQNGAGQDVLLAPVPKWSLGATVVSFPKKSVLVGAKSSARVTLRLSPGQKLKAWSPNSPNLYGAVFKVSGAKAITLDSHYVRFGWRQFEIRGRDLLLNGQKIQLVGDFLHPFGPYIGSRRFVWGFYKTIKDVGGNATRPHGQLHPRIFLELADEMGLCVLDEAAVFGSSINLNLKEDVTWRRLEKHVDDMVHRDRNHPSVFGWSPGNEMFALFAQAQGSERGREVELMKALARRPLALDSTRQWVSVDGDEDLEGALPVWSRHWGMGVPNPRELPQTNKPRMMGEHGGTYFAGPGLMAGIIGDRAFESYAARNKALGVEVYRTITQSAKPEMAFFSPSELAWFGLEQLPYGYRTDLRPPGKSDGVFFPNYLENQPGVQIERLPPYVATVNPGFDPKLPLYKPLAMFDAMKAALSPTDDSEDRWTNPVVPPRRFHPAPTNAITSVAFLGDPTGPLHQSLTALGVPLSTDAAVNFLVIDAQSLQPGQVTLANEAAQAVLRRGGRVWVMARDRNASLGHLSALFPAPVALTERKSSSLLYGQIDPRIYGFSREALNNIGDKNSGFIQRAGIDGPLVQEGKVLLKASNSDWSLFERQPEPAKTSSMLIYEHLRKPSGVALLEVPSGDGQLLLSTLDASADSRPARRFWSQLWRNFGVKLTPPLGEWLVQTGADADVEWRYTTSRPEPNWQSPEFNDSNWQTGLSGFGGEVPEGQPKTPWSGSEIYLRKEFNLTQLPKDLTLHIHHDEDVQVFLNGTLIFEAQGFTSQYQEVALDAKALGALQVGRNVVAVSCKQTAGGQFIDVGLLGRAPEVQGQKPAHDLLLDGPLK